MVAADEWYARPLDQPNCNYLPCGFCDGEGCCVCDYFGAMHKDHPMFGAILSTDDLQEGK